MSRRFAVVHEAEADFNTATELADRVIRRAIDWLEEDDLPGQREWVAIEPNGERLTWRAIPRLAHEAGIRARGQFDGVPGEADAKAARRAILYLLATFPDLEAIVLVRDQDRQPERRRGLDQARQTDHSGLPIVVGLAAEERENWVVCGFDPDGDAESARLAEQAAALRFDPRTRSHELTACKDDNAPRSPKRVLGALTGGDWHRQRRCWTVTPLEVLRERGGSNGLADFMNEVLTRLAPLLGRVEPD